MNKKIKVIELINKIYANVDVPKRLKLGEVEYSYSNIHADYYNERFEQFLFSHLAIHKINWLSIELEILEDEDEDEDEIDIQNIDIIRDYRTSDDDLYNDNFNDFKSTINDLVQAVKQLDKKINKEE